MARLLLVLIVAFAAANLGLKMIVDRAGWANRPVDIQSRNLYDGTVDRFFQAHPGQPTAVFLGDSVVFGKKLEKTMGAAWSDHTLPAAFSRLAPQYATLNLGINGVLFSELTCVAADLGAHHPRLLVINLSPRPFSTDFAKDAGSRAFLCRKPAVGKGALMRLPVVAYRDLWQQMVLDRPVRRLVNDAVGRWVGPPPEEAADEDLADVIWRIQAAQRYNGLRVGDDHPQAAALAGLVEQVSRMTDTQTLFFYLEENVAAIEEQLDRAHYDQHQRRFKAKVENLVRQHARNPRQIQFVVISRDALASQYDDHVHLTADGYRTLAGLLLKELGAQGKDGVVR